MSKYEFNIGCEYLPDDVLDINSLTYNQLSESYATELVNELYDMYNSYKRVYHDWQHARQMINFGKKHADLIQNLRVFNWATLYHDSIYDPHNLYGVNEVASSEFATTRLEGLLPRDEMSEVNLFIISTREHNPIAIVPQMDIFLDADLAILGSSPEEYQKYCNGVKKEFEWMPQERYIKNRINVLSGFLKRENIYTTPEVSEQLEAQAILNLKKELSDLQSS